MSLQMSRVISFHWPKVMSYVAPLENDSAKVVWTTSCFYANHLVRTAGFGFH